MTDPDVGDQVASGGGAACRDASRSRQAALVRALLAGGPVPPGFDPRRVRIEAAALRNKRRRIAERLRPDLADALGDRFVELFDRWATERTRHTSVSFHEDLEAFAAWLVAHGHLS